MASPRKFSEKIALHTKKQAEETAEFEAVIREVSATTRAALEKQQQHLEQPNSIVFRGGSLPNVNQMSNNSVDLQNALQCLEDMKQGSGRQSLIDKIHRDRNRQMASQRKQSPLEKRADCSPYSLSYLVPPTDTSWRRTNSDSAIHSMTMQGHIQQQQPHHPQQQQASPPSPTSPINRHAASSSLTNNHFESLWHPEKVLSSQVGRQCDVPGISIYPSPEQDMNIHMTISNNTGSLPDLTELHFTSPLGAPIDGNDQAYMNVGKSPGNLSPTRMHHHIGPVRTGQQARSPGGRQRTPRGPSPLVLYGSNTSQFGGSHTALQQGDCSLETNLSRIDLESPATILHQGVHYPLKSADVTGHNCWSANNGYISNGTNGASRPAPPKITVSELTANGMVDVTDLHLNGGQMYSQEFSCSDCQQTNRTLYSPSGQNQGRGNLSCAMANSQHIERRIRTHSSSPIRPSNHGCHPYSRDNSPMRSNQMADCWFEESLHGPVASNQSPNFGSYAQGGGGSLTQYRNSTEGPQSPTSPLSQHSYSSPSPSPGLPNNTLSSSPFSDMYSLQQQQQQQHAQQFVQTNAQLQQQFEQFSMLQDTPTTAQGLYTLIMQHQQQQSNVGQCSPGTKTIGNGQNNFTQPDFRCPVGDYYGRSDANQIQYNHHHHHHNHHQSQNSQMPFSARPYQMSNINSQSNNKIPDIVLTGVEENLRAEQDFVKDICNIMSESSDEYLSLDEALQVGLNPLELEELQMLTCPNQSIADPATEDSFRLDQV